MVLYKSGMCVQSKADTMCMCVCVCVHFFFASFKHSSYLRCSLSYFSLFSVMLLINVTLFAAVLIITTIISKEMKKKSMSNDVVWVGIIMGLGDIHS